MQHMWQGRSPAGAHTRAPNLCVAAAHLNGECHSRATFNEAFTLFFPCSGHCSTHAAQLAKLPQVAMGTSLLAMHLMQASNGTPRRLGRS